MRTCSVILLAGLSASGCTAPGPPPEGAWRPTGVYGFVADDDIGAINLAQWAFADPARTRNDPVDGARAAAAVVYLADELSDSPRWVGMSPTTKLQMKQANVEVREALGIASDAPSRLVTTRLLNAAAALQAGDRASAAAALESPAFTLGPEPTLARLANLPFLPAANVATQHAALQRFPGCLGCR